MNQVTAAALVQSGWDKPAVTLTPEQQREIELQTWLDSKAALEKAKEAEMAARVKVISLYPLPADKKEGTLNIPLNNNYKLKVVLKQNYNIDNVAIDAALDAIEKFGAEGKFVADRLVKFKADLSLTEYRLLADDNATETQKKIKAEIDKVLTITDGSPTLELVAPKAAKN